jgi:hypothetical protein
MMMENTESAGERNGPPNFTVEVLSEALQKITDCLICCEGVPPAYFIGMCEFGGRIPIELQKVFVYFEQQSAFKERP